MLNAPIFAYTDASPAPAPRFGPLQASHRQWPICANPYATRVTAYVGSNSETDRRIEMPPSGISVNQRHLAEGKYGWPLLWGNGFKRTKES